MLPLPPPPDGLQVVSIDSLEAALAKMDIKVSMKDLISAIREVEEAKCAKLIADSERRAVLSERKSSATAARLLSFTPVQYASRFSCAGEAFRFAAHNNPLFCLPSSNTRNGGPTGEGTPASPC